MSPGLRFPRTVVAFRALAFRAHCVAALLLLPAWLSCGRTVEVGIDDALSIGGGAATGGLNLAGGATGGETGRGGANDGGVGPCVATPCRGRTYACGNCLDDDQDAAVDALDPDCLGPCDDDEQALGTSLPGGQSAACRQDCYFDGDGGPGNDGCQWSHSCDPLSVAPDYPPSGEARCAYDPGGQGPGLDCSVASDLQSPECLELCLPLVPNGCDCFGCCELPAGSGEFRFVGSGGGDEPGCRLDELDDPLCRPCTPVPSCLNACEECEVCVGRGPDLRCGGNTQCPSQQSACGAGAPCPVGAYCVTGCCVRAPEPT